jgi:lipoprotein-anchoring transpeptidase ErfK/SrfK
MYKQIAIASGLVFSALVMTTMVSVPQASAELYFDYDTRSWVKHDPRARLRYRKPAPKKYRKRNVSIKTNEAPGTIIIDTDKKYLFYVNSGNSATRYGIGVGREGFGWNGNVKIQRKAEWPNWTPPPAMRSREGAKGNILPASMKGGINNPLGARAMYLYKGGNDTMYRIHGTNEPWTIGMNVSSGCIRLENKDVEELYRKAKIGTKVVVIGPGKSSAGVYTQGVSFFGG